MPSATDRVAAALRAKGVTAPVREFPRSTRTAQDAADAIGTTVAQIVKSLVFLADGAPVLVLVSGANRVDLRKLGAAASAHTVEKADAALVRRVTGFSVGGVPPVGHLGVLPVFIDADLLHYEVVYAAAGTPRAIFAVDPHVLAQITEGRAIDLRES